MDRQRGKRNAPQLGPILGAQRNANCPWLESAGEECPVAVSGSSGSLKWVSKFRWWGCSAQAECSLASLLWMPHRPEIPVHDAPPCDAWTRTGTTDPLTNRRLIPPTSERNNLQSEPIGVESIEHNGANADQDG